MSLVPDGKSKKIEFFKARLDKWELNASEIGTTVEAVDDLAELVQEAREALQAQQVAYSKAQSATLRLNTALDKMGTAGAAIIKQIRARADLAGVGVFPLASIPPRAKPAPIGAPGKPYSMTTRLGSLGTLGLRWKCDHPAGSVGTMYQISRQLEDAGPFEFLDVVGKKRFVDRTIPAGTARVVYRIRAFRSTKTGPAADFPVSIGVSRAHLRLLNAGAPGDPHAEAA
jgi:hypothetical protein